ncbi:MAG: hypothetical protein HQ518_00985 [Rhodopirellula sp.]|nr:hypothetical protein [Rhodopirellula sp.]
MALNEPVAESDLIWLHPSVPMFQMLALFGCVHGTWHEFSTYQDDDEFGICIKRLDASAMHVEELSPIYRYRSAHELPTGVISDASYRQNDRRNIASIHLRVNGKAIELSSGEIYECQDGSFEIKMMDESVLVQIDGRSPNAT